MSRLVSLAVLLAIIVVIGMLFYKVMIGFFVPVFLAAVLVVVCQPVHRWVLTKCNRREHVAAAITTCLILLSVLLPIGLVLTNAAIQGTSLFSGGANAASIRLVLNKARAVLGLEMPHPAAMEKIKTELIAIQTEIGKTDVEIGLLKNVLASHSDKMEKELKALETEILKSIDRITADIKKKLLTTKGLSDSEPIIIKRILDDIKSIHGFFEPPPGENLQPIQLQSPEELRKSVDQILEIAKRLISDSRVIETKKENKNDEVNARAKADEPKRPLHTIVQELESECRLLIAWNSFSPKTFHALDNLTPKKWSKSIDAIEYSPRSDASDEAIASEPTEILEYQARAIDLGLRWRELKDALFGGKSAIGGSNWAFLVESSNPNQKEIKELTDNFFDNMVRPRLLSVTTATGGFLFELIIGCAILIVALYFFLYDGPGMIRAMMQLSPLDDRYERQLLMEFDRISRAIFMATILSALAQGLMAGIGYYFAGVHSLGLIIPLTTVCALIPFIGPAIVWVPVCLYLGIVEERVFAAVCLAAWGLAVVATIDNVVKTYVLHGQSQLHPLLALLSVLGGVKALGPIGIIVGPMAVTLLQTLLGILQHELTNLDADQKIFATEAKPVTNVVRKLKQRKTRPEPPAESKMGE